MSTAPNALQSQPTPAPVPQQAAPQEPTVAMIAPDGTSGSIPQSKVDEALKAGGKLAVHMTAPDGSKGVIPFDQQDAAQKAGGKWDVHPENDAVKQYMTKQQADAAAKPMKDLSDQNRLMLDAMTAQGKDYSADPNKPVSLQGAPAYTLSADERKEAAAGRKAGTIAGATQIALAPVGELVGPALEWLGIGGETAEPFVDNAGKPIVQGAKSFAGKILQQPMVQKAIKHAVRGAIGAGIGEATGGHTGGAIGGTIGSMVSDKVLKWILSE